MNLEPGEASDLLKRVTQLDLVKLLAIKAADDARGNGCNLVVTCEATAADGPTVKVHVRVTRPRVKRARKGAA